MYQMKLVKMMEFKKKKGKSSFSLHLIISNQNTQNEIEKKKKIDMQTKPI